MYLIVIAWMYVVLAMCVAEAVSSQGSVLGALITFVLYGLLPLGIVMYIFGTPGRRRRRAAAEAAADAPADPSAAQRDGGGHAAGAAPGPVAPEREEP